MYIQIYICKFGLRLAEPVDAELTDMEATCTGLHHFQVQWSLPNPELSGRKLRRLNTSSSFPFFPPNILTLLSVERAGGKRGH